MAGPLNVLSLGAGVQSTTMALMAAHGLITPMPDAAIFADTGWEPKEVMEHLRWLMSPNVLPFPVHIASAGNIRDDIMRGNSARTRSAFASVPWFYKSIKANGSYTAGMGKRQCTAHYKLEPIGKKLRELLGKPGRAYIAPASVTIWIGISTDEAMRMKPPKQRYQTGRWPLLEMNISRRACEAWLVENDYPIPPKSACVGCPFHDDAAWAALMTNPETRADLIEVDGTIRQGGSGGGIRAEQYMHRDLKPIAEVDFDKMRDQIDLFNNECEGMCGV